MTVTREPYRAIDATNTEIRLSKPAERILCLTATGIDILVELGLEPIGYLSQGIAGHPEAYSFPLDGTCG
ncbi:hypothetical protein [Leptolyngbya sp. 7M]|uniref:hypothetical protein n=1 Tax=Leptolyngbya sp. 7M TaxID=2812896 RepID=UPI001B8C4E2A|nr:hypothetical protein [Leptolyngbya sp. 7M]QYO67960.1 hypothetical protein JVX88_14985 [Leptolyngbya sp. 7M]